MDYHLFGGSAGREGVAVQLGATISNSISKKLMFINNPRIFLVVGMAAGFAGIFQTPLAAIFFALEVLVAGSLIYEALLPVLTTSFVASFTSHFLGLEKFSVTLNETINLSGSNIFKIIIVAILFGIVGGIFAKILDFSKRFFVSKINNPIKKIFIMGCGLSILLLLLHFGRYSGLGTNTLLAPIFIGIEVFGSQNIVVFVIVCVIAYVFNGNKTIYSLQRRGKYIYENN